MKAVIKKIFHTILVLVSIVLFSISLFIKFEFGDPQFEQIIDTMYMPKGSSMDVIMDGVRYCFPIVLIMAAILIIPIYLKNKREYNFKIKNKVIKILPYSKSIYVCLVFCLLVVYSLISMGFFNWVYNNIATTNLFDEYYVDPSKVEITFPEEKKNLIYIYMESMESSYVNFNIDGKNINMIPSLSSIAINNTYFSNTSSFGGALRTPLATWTVAGQVAQMGGIPLKSSVKRNKYVLGSKKFLPGATFLGDILEQNSYKNYYLLGSNASFAGTRHLFEEHGNYEIYDYKWAKENEYIPEDYKINWGYEDKKLYEFAKERLIEISKNDEPFNFTMITIDTHAVDGYTDDSCKNTYDYVYANSIRCADSMIEDFISWVQEQDFYEDTVIIIVGDHLTMQTNVKHKISEPHNRTIYNAFINSSVNTSNTKNRIFTQLDFFPTTLAALGATIDGDRLGLGTNLFSDKKTLAEEIGYIELCDEISKKSKYYDKNILK